jgi:plastocyanin
MQTPIDSSMAGSRRPRRARTLILAALLTLVAACSKNASPTAPYGGGGGNVGGGGGAGSPGTLFNLGPFAVGQSARHDFASAGSFGYHCIPHQAMGMVGTVQVDAAGADSVVVQIAVSGFNFTPSMAHIKPGGYVRWVNASNSSIHTVTSDS